MRPRQSKRGRHDEQIGFFIKNKMNSSFRKKIFLLIIISFFVRVIIASFTELGNDEVYYWTYSQYLQWNYFDHPPMVAIWIRLFTGNLSLQQYELFVRLGSLVSCAFATWIMYDIGRKLHSEKAGFFIACLYNTSLYASIIAGVFIMPDSPQMLFWTLSLLMLLKICRNEKNWSNWLLFGVCTGLCLMSKVHGIFIWIGLGSFVLIRKRTWLKMPQLYVAVILSAIIASPILFWNIANNFITYKYHSDRVTINQFEIHIDGFLREFFGQILYNNPVNVVLIVIALTAFFKRKIFKEEVLTLYAFIALPMAIILLALSLFRDTLPHWSGPAYVTLLPLAGCYLTTRKIENQFPAFLKTAFGLIIFAVVAGLIIINFYPGTIGEKSLTNLGDGDFTLDMGGWKNAGKQFQTIYQKDVQSGAMPANADMICYKWFPAAHEDYYFCHPIGMRMIGIGIPFDLHEYLWYNAYRENGGSLDKVYCIVPSNENYDVYAAYSKFYNNIDSITTIESFRSNKLVRSFYIYRLSGWKGVLPVN
jgi:hypothetical protein